MNKELQVLSPEIIESLVLNGDISKLTPVQKVQYYNAMCERLGLDSATQPFKILKLSGKEVLYCDRSGGQQLNKLHNISHSRVHSETVNDVYLVFMRASLPTGRFTDSCGAVSIGGLKGNDLANALMKTETKAKRRATLDICGLGMLDESEIETIPNAKTAELKEPMALASEPLSPEPKPLSNTIPESIVQPKSNVKIPDTILKDVPIVNDNIKNNGKNYSETARKIKLDLIEVLAIKAFRKSDGKSDKKAFQTWLGSVFGVEKIPELRQEDLQQAVDILDALIKDKNANV